MMQKNIFNLLLIRILIRLVPVFSLEDGEIYTSLAAARTAVDSVKTSLPAGKKIQVLTSESSPPFAYLDSSTGKMAGFIPDLLTKISQDLGVEFAYQQEYNFGQAHAKSLSVNDLWENTVAGQVTYDTLDPSNEDYQQEVDLMASSAWRTTSRLKNYGSLRWVHSFYIAGTSIAVRQREITTWDTLILFLNPFTALGWLLIAALVLTNTFFIAFFRLSAQEQEDQETNMVRDESRSSYFFRKLVKDFWITSQGLFGKTWFSLPKTAADGILMFSFAFVCMIFLASYTSSLTTIMQMNVHQLAELKSFDDFARSGTPVCVPSGTALPDMIRLENPSVKQYVYDYTSFEAAHRLLVSGVCGGVSGDTPILENRASDYCDLNVLQNTEMKSFNYAWGFAPSSMWAPIAPALSYMIAYYRNNGEFDQLWKGTLSQGTCSKASALTERDRDSDDPYANARVQGTNLLGLCFIYLIFVFLALLAYMETKRRQGVGLPVEEVGSGIKKVGRGIQGGVKGIFACKRRIYNMCPSVWEFYREMFYTFLIVVFLYFVVLSFTFYIIEGDPFYMFKIWFGGSED